MTKENPKQISPAELERFIAVQEKELTIREKELVNTQHAMAYNHEYALKSLDAQLKDRENTRQHESNSAKFRYGFASVIIIGLFVLFIVAIMYNKDEIVMEIVKAILYVGAGALGGYSWRDKAKRSECTDTNEYST